MTVNPRTSTWPCSSATASLSLAPGYDGRGGGLGVVFGAVVVVVVLVLLAGLVVVVVGGGSLGVTGAAGLDDTVGSFLWPSLLARLRSLSHRRSQLPPEIRRHR